MKIPVRDEHVFVVFIRKCGSTVRYSLHPFNLMSQIIESRVNNEWLRVRNNNKIKSKFSFDWLKDRQKKTFSNLSAASIRKCFILLLTDKKLTL